jgi:tetratricopeptide (TPR) repeat protein
MAMDASDYDEALRLFEGAHEMYPSRPEHLLNMGSIYANQGNPERAVWAYEEAIKAVHSDRFADLDAEGQAQWQSFEEMAQINLSQMRGQAGVDAFQADEYDRAIELFNQAAESNPYSRDFRFNVVQARFAKAQGLEEARDTTAEPGQAPQDAELLRLYEQLPGDVAKARELDPNNENLMLILARARRRHGELSGSIEASQQETLKVLEELQAMPATISQVLVAPGEGTATVTGMAKNNGVEPGTSVNVEVTLYASDGTEIAKSTAPIQLGDADAEQEFSVTVPGVDRQVAGWRYVVSS